MGFEERGENMKKKLKDFKRVGSARVYASNGSRRADTSLSRAKGMVESGRAVLIKDSPYSIRITFEHEMEKSLRKVIERGISENTRAAHLSLAAKGAYWQLVEQLQSSKLYYRIPDDIVFLADILNVGAQELVSIRKELIEHQLTYPDNGYLVFNDVMDEHAFNFGPEKGEVAADKQTFVAQTDSERYAKGGEA